MIKFLDFQPMHAQILEEMQFVLGVNSILPLVY